mgnify:CR=1 FL=1
MSEGGRLGPTATSDALAGTEWRIVAVDGQPVGGEAPLLVSFGHDGRVTGTTGVNSFTASYTLTAEYLTFGPMATTRRAAPPELQEQEQRVIGSLAGICPVALAAHTLELVGPRGRVELHSTRPLPEPASGPPGPPGPTG